MTPMTWPDLVSRPRPAPDLTIAYGTDPLQVVDLWRPDGHGPVPVIMVVHGGCWQTDIADRRLMDWAAADLRGAGLAVWNIDYRGVDRAGGGYPGTFRDVAAAADLLIEEGPRLGLDCSAVVALGHSAGGHLALWLAARSRLPAASPLHTAITLPIAHVVSLGGLADLEAVATSADQGCGTEVVTRLIGSGRSDPYADTSLPRLLPIGVGQDVVSARDDAIVPSRFGARHVAAAQAAGDRARLTIVPGGHVDLIAPGSPAWAEAKRLTLAAVAAAADPASTSPAHRS